MFRALFGSLVAAQVVYGRLPEDRRVPLMRAIMGLMLAASTVEAAQARGPRRGPALVATAGAIGFLVEVVGVATGRPFGHYSYGPALGPRVRGVPLLVGVAWAMLARPAWVVAGLIARTPLARIAVASGALTAWDVFLDPRMVREGYWTWSDGGAYEGVPLSNFAGWAATGALVYAVWAVIDPDDDPAVDGDGALALYAWNWGGESFANAALWGHPRIAAIGGAAMGAFAGPALRARLRA